MLLASLAVGAVVGVLSGLLGIGGGTILVPVFKLGYGLAPIASTATSLVTIIPTSISGAISHIRRKTCVPALGVAAGLGGALTSPLGVWLAALSPGWLVMAAAAAVIAYSAITMFSKALKAPKPAGAKAAQAPRGAGDEGAVAPRGERAEGAVAPRGAGVVVAEACDARAVGPAGSGAESAAAARGDGAGAAAAARGETVGVPEAPRMTRRQLALGFGVGVLAGVASGYVGLGGGFIMVPLMVSLFRIPMKLTSGTSLIAVAILVVPAAVAQTIYGNVAWLPAIAVAVGSVPGALLGAKLIPHMPERTLRFVFSGFLLVGAVLLALNQTGLM